MQVAEKYSKSNQQRQLAPPRTLGGVTDSPTTKTCYLYIVRVTHLKSLFAAEANWLCGPGTGQNLCFFGNFKQG